MQTTGIRKIATFLTVVLALSGSVSAAEPNRPDSNAPARRMRPTTGKDLYKQMPEKLFSPSVSQLFYEMAYEISHRDNMTDSQAEQAVALLNAAMEMDSSAGSATADMLEILSRPRSQRHLQMLYDTLIKYTDKNADSLVAINAAKYLLNQLDSRQQRETLLRRMIQDIGQSNYFVSSELATTLALLFVEKADNTNAIKLMAGAYARNKYNELAYEKLVEMMPNQISPVLSLEHLRFKLRKNPLDLEAAIALAQYSQKIQLYDIAAGNYEYCADLFQFLYPGQNVPTAVYIDWMTCCYNTPRGQTKCLQLADQFRKQGRFNLQIEVIAARAAAKTGDTKTAGQIIETAEQKAIQATGELVDYKSLAWFYCFIRKNPEKAVDYANKAYAAEPNSPVTAGLLACAMVDSNQLDSAKPLFENFPQTQFADFAKARFNLAKGQKQPAVDSLRAAIDKDPGSIVTEQALMLLDEQKSEYIPIYDTNTIMAAFKQSVGEQVIPQFLSPDKMLSFQLNVRGNKFAYGSDFTGVITITNNWYEPVVISEDGLYKGRIIIDANVTGDISGRYGKLVLTTTRPSQPIEPGRGITVPVRLYAGPLKQLLLNHPQASLHIQFTASLDPVTTPDGNLISAIPGMKPVIVDIDRPRSEITQGYLQNRFNSLTQDKQGPKIKAAQLFAGLLMENREMANSTDSARNGQVSYKFVSNEGMNTMLESALAQCLTDSDWVVRTHGITAIAELPLNYKLTNAVAAGLNDQHWPTRMTAVWLLAQKQGYNFTKVIDRIAQYDESNFVRNMAIAFGAKVAQPAQQVTEEQFPDLLKRDPNADSNNIFPLPSKQ
jgi:tetratricopeptide (TPR) repeat protein